MRGKILLAIVLFSQATQADYLYWSDANTGKIQFGDARGSGWGGPIDYYDFTDGLIQPRGVALDLVNRQIYWSDGFAKTISRANLDWVSSPEVLLTNADGLINPTDVAIDLANGYLYWADVSAAKVSRADLDGSNPIVLYDFLDGLVQPVGVAIDPANDLIYWADANQSRIQHAPLSTPGIPQTLFDSSDGLVLGMQVTMP